MKPWSMFSFFNKVTFDPRSGRPIAPLYWNLIGFMVACAWFMSALLFFGAWVGIRDGQPVVAIVLALAGASLPASAHWRKGQLRKQQAEFDRLLRAYEQTISRLSS
jgi:hypothetical protein